VSAHPKTPAPKIQPVVKNAATAPIIYFDSVPTFGVMANVMEIDLSATVLALFADNSVKRESVCVAHLRCSTDAMVALRNAIDQALKMSKAMPGTMAASDDDDDIPSPGDALARRMEAMKN